MLAEIVITLTIPLGLDLYLPTPADNPLTLEKVVLGRRLFFDKRLSRDESVSCATCHQPNRAFTDGRAVAIGITGRVGRRSAPALINRAYGQLFFWDGRARSLEEQVLKPIEDEDEMGFSVSEAAARVGESVDGMSQALASFVRTILSGDSPFDRFINGDLTALTSSEQAGLQIFRGKGNCVSCHVGPNMTDERLHNTGAAWRNGAFADRGAGRGEFKTPTLREVARTSPYMHDGSLATLEEVVNFYDGGGRPNPSLDADIRPLHLTDLEKSELVAFLGTLSGMVVEGSSAPRHRNDTPIALVQHRSRIN